MVGKDQSLGAKLGEEDLKPNLFLRNINGEKRAAEERKRSVWCWGGRGGGLGGGGWGVGGGGGGGGFVGGGASQLNRNPYEKTQPEGKRKGKKGKEKKDLQEDQRHPKSLKESGEDVENDKS